MSSFYLKYRPQKVADLDLTSVREFFERILTSGKVVHAYLFTGPRGTGKTSAARILAKMVNCERNLHSAKGRGHRVDSRVRDAKHLALSAKQFHEPCNKCQMCVSITNGSNVDLIEIDAASNRGIDDIRDLREKIRLAPVAATKKVYIIDEVHMLTLEAFNALLKTLEEPPEHALFVLATTEAHKVPETIASRCVRLNFPKGTRDEVKRSLSKVIKGEGLKIDEQAVEELAGAVDGSFREGVKILEQLALVKVKITVEMVRQELGKSEQVNANRWLGWLAVGDLPQAIKELDRLESTGVNWQVFITEALERLRVKLLKDLGVEIDGVKMDKLDLSTSETQDLVELLLRAGKEMKGAVIPQLPLELVAVEWCARLKSAEDSADRNFEDGRWKMDTEDRKVDVLKSREVKSSKIQDLSLKTSTFETSNKPATASEDKSSKTTGIKLEDMERRWGEVLAKVKPHNHSVEGLLRSTRPVEVAGDRLKIEVFYQFHLEQLKQERFLQIVEGAVEEIFARKLKLEYHLGSRSSQVRQVKEVENISGIVEDEDIIKVAEEVFGSE